MDKISIVGLSSEKEAVMDALMKLGAVELYEPTREEPQERSAAGRTTPESASSASGDAIADADALQTKMKNAIELAARFHQEKKPMFAAKRRIPSDVFVGTVARRTEIEAAADELSAGVSAISGLQSQIVRYRLLTEQIRPWTDVPIPVDNPETASTRLRLGTVANRAELTKLQALLEPLDEELDLVVLTEKDDVLQLCIVTLKQSDDQAASLLKGSVFRPLVLSGASGRPGELFDEYTRRAEEAEGQVQALTKSCAALSARLADYEILYDHASILLEKALSDTRLHHTGYTFLLQGWVPSDLTLSLEKALHEDFFVAFHHEPATSEDDFPILLKNHPLVKPYEVVTEMFSPPSTKDVDPNPIMAPFFLLFFSMMLSDAGYGLALAALCALLIWKFKVSGGLRSMCMFMFQGSLVSVIWGLLFGGFFGDLITAVSSGRFSFPTIWFNPIENPIKLMVWSVLFGTLHLFAGLLTKAYILTVTGKWLDAVLDIYPWIVTITGLGLLLGGPAMGIPVLADVGKYMALAGAAVLILFGGRDSRNPIVRILKGLIGLYGITGYFSDILSYTRILALSLATGVIAMVVNMLGSIAGFGFVGILLFIVVGLLGHLLNLALSALGCYVHTSRLQYVEFFSKFYEGGGRVWNPLSIKTRYVDIVRTP